MSRWGWGLVAALAFGTNAHAQLIFANGFECPDADGDRLSDCEEAIRNTLANDADTDDDGLSDGDEVLGTAGGLNLPAFGVDPRHKDLLVEMDWDRDSRGCGVNHSHRPPASAVEGVRIFYASIPIANPDGIDGINFIADYGQGPAPFTGGDEVDYLNGVSSQLGFDFFNQKALHYDPKRAGYIRYQAHAHFYLNNDPSSGYANVWGDNSVITLNCKHDNPDYVRNTIIHELGHNLSLQHGGDVACNGKPNYNSLMNYNYQLNGIDTDCDRAPNGIDNLGYSQGDRMFLEQDNLNEPQGVCPLDNPQHKAIDWNGNGIIDGLPVSYPGSFSVVPLACATVTTSADHNDYAALLLKPTSPPDGAGAPVPGEDSGACPPVPEDGG